MNKYIFVFFAAIGLFFPKAQGLVIHDVDTSKPLLVHFSKNHGNRIAVSNGIVKKMLGPPNFCSIKIEEESGQAFINLLKPPKQSIVLSVVTGNGFVQDLEVVFEDIISEVVILKEPSLHGEIEEKKLGSADIDDSVSSIIKALLKNRLPRGFSKKKQIEYEVRESYEPNVRFELKAVVENSIEKINIYNISNIGKKDLVLHEKLLKRGNDLWVYLEKNDLKPREKIFAFISEVKKVYE